MTLFLLFLLLCLFIAYQFHQIPPYMDELFHIPQAQRYCLGNLSFYDPLLTTPPGLYLLSAFFYNILSLQCSTVVLRMTNVFYSFGIYRLVSCYQSLQVSALSVSLFPVSFFFHFLYYSDSGSTFWVLLCLHLCHKRRFNWSGLAGFMSLWFRQTNILWVAFAFGYSIVLSLQHLVKFEDSECRQVNLEKSLKLLSCFLYQSCKNVRKLLWICKVFVLDFIFFGAFLWWNKGIVLGDKSNHVPVLHIAQIYYFVVFSTFFLIPWIDYKYFGLFLSRISCSYTFLVGMIIAWTVQHFTIQHPFLLSDNRHFSFYIWRWFFKSNEWIRYCLIPGYLFCFICIWSVLRRMGLIWTIGYTIAVGLTLIPSPLLEFRYFILPFLILRIFAIRPNIVSTSIYLECILYTLVNVFVLTLFLMKPFQWAHLPGVDQRFMW